MIIKSSLRLFIVFFLFLNYSSSYALVGTITSLVINAVSKAQGNICLKEGTVVGEKLTSPAGHTGIITSVSAVSPLCKAATNPIQANVEFTYTFESKFMLDLTDEYELKPIDPLNKYNGTVINAVSKNKKSNGFTVNARKRTGNADPQGIADAIAAARNNILSDVVSKNPEQLVVNGFNTWSFEQTGVTKGVFGSKITYLTSIIDSRDEIIVIVHYSAESDADKNFYASTINKFSGLEPLNPNQLYEIPKITIANQGSSSLGMPTIANKDSDTSQLKPSPITTTASKRALVIGNDSYRTISKLLTAREDARTIASALTTFGYKTTLRLDLNEKEMKTALRTFASQVEGGDEVIVFFAGHGVQIGATNYLLPTDIIGENEAQIKDEAIQLQRILSDMSDRKAKFTLAMIDACRDNPFKSSLRDVGSRGLAPTTAATGQMVIFSAGVGQRALDKLNNTDRDKNGVFTRVFIQEIQKNSQTIDRVIKNVRSQVAELAKSVGHEQVPAIYDQVLGDFYFKK
jgi:hypothetical protein